MNNPTFMRQELQTITTCFDMNTMALKTAKARVFGYYGIDIKAASKESFLKKFANHIKALEND